MLLLLQDFYFKFLILFSISSLEITPTVLSICFPSLKNTNVGIEITPNLWARSRLSSTFTFANFALSFISEATSSTAGDKILHGPHQTAQKSTTTLSSFMNLSKLFLSNSTTPFVMYEFGELG